MGAASREDGMSQRYGTGQRRVVAEGGQEVACGLLTDKYGFSWQIVPSVLLTLTGDPDQEKASRVTAAMLTMVKLDIAALERAYAGS
jgi:predicted 3-demethylubiquinone-9 3-methyltransferase (glyoxalase superfamily)